MENKSDWSSKESLKTLSTQARNEVQKITEALVPIDRKVDKKSPLNERARQNLGFLNELLNKAPFLREYLTRTGKQIILSKAFNPWTIIPMPDIAIADRTLSNNVGFDSQGVVMSFFSDAGYRKRVPLSIGWLDTYFETGHAGALSLKKFADTSRESLLKKIVAGIK
ncbi:MAG: hypothetical protein HYT07_03470 [Candidatus Levybacteria bacterium]|nr:hypothetical protein [Candidatus Levybacteria bacterium]